MAERAIAVTLPTGAVEVPATVVAPDDAWLTVVLAHGAGAGREHPFLTGFADALAAAGVATVRFDFPYRVAGRRMPGPPGHAVATWQAVAAASATLVPDVPWAAAGKSYGGRMASMAAAEDLIRPAALVYLGYPLHPPGKPEKARREHLPQITTPQLFLTGTNDPFVHPLSQLEGVVDACPDAAISWVIGGGHSFEIKGAKRPADEVGASCTVPVLAWLRDRLS